jgi:hypothetical protein
VCQFVGGVLFFTDTLNMLGDFREILGELAEVLRGSHDVTGHALE